MPKASIKEGDSTELATVNTNVPMAVAGLSLDDLEQDSGKGFQAMEASDLATPLVRILQSNSPQCKRSDSAYIQGATEGMFYNNVTQEVSSSLAVVPCYFEKCFIEWKPNRGGYVANHPADTPLRNDMHPTKTAEGKEVMTLTNGNVMVETNQHFVLIIRDDGSYEPAVLPLVSTGLRTSRMWNSLMKKVVVQKNDGTTFHPASYYMSYKLTSKGRTKDSYSWYTMSVEPSGPVPSRAIYNAGKEFEKAISQGVVQVKHDVDEDAPVHAAAPTINTPADDEIPF